MVANKAIIINNADSNEHYVCGYMEVCGQHKFRQ